jgi:hypothetical protein
MRVIRPVAGLVAALSIAAGVAGQAPDIPTVLASEISPLVLNLHFTSSDSLSASSRRALMAEAESIWKPGHVRLKWLGESADADEGVTLRIVVVARPVPTAKEHSPWTVAELVRLEGSRAIAIASTIGARRIVDESQWNRLMNVSAIQDHRLGIVLGRAVAHEIGHYVLDTNTHAKHGLMRARIDASEFADLRSGGFRLDEAAEAHLATLAAKGPLSPEIMTGFSYPAR